MAVHSNLSANFLESEEFGDVLTVAVKGGVSRWKRGMESWTEELKHTIRDHFQGLPVCLIIDGWRVPYHSEHAHAILFSDWSGKIVFHRLVGDLEKHDGVYIGKLMFECREKIIEEYGANVTSVVTDNAPAIRELQNQLFNAHRIPIIGHACCAHWLQLALHDTSTPPDSSVLSAASSYGVIHTKKALEVCAAIRKVFASSKVALSALRCGASASTF